MFLTHDKGTMIVIITVAVCHKETDSSGNEKRVMIIVRHV